jgi:hypothetical protein
MRRIITAAMAFAVLAATPLADDPLPCGEGSPAPYLIHMQ